MAQLGFLLIDSVTCEATEDFTGRDTLIGVLGSTRFPIGSFTEGQTRILNIEQIVPAGVSTLKLFEEDLIDADDLIASIDLTEETDIDRVVSTFEGAARYVIRFRAVTQPR